jgi:hypothetical protein
MGKVSSKSVTRFVKLWLEIEKPDAYFHQTLTFPPPERDFASGKEAVGKLLDNLHHRFEMASLYVAGRQKLGALHFHVLSFFYSPVSPSAQACFKQAVWTAWQNLHAGACVRDANRFFRRDEFLSDRLRTMGYFSKEVRLLEGRWWGVRNYKLVRKHSRAVTRTEIKQAVDHLFPRRPLTGQRATVAESPTPKFTKRHVQSMREHVEAGKKWTWEEFKRRETKLARKVPEWEFLDWLNAHG